MYKTFRKRITRSKTQRKNRNKNKYFGGKVPRINEIVLPYTKYNIILNDNLITQYNADFDTYELQPDYTFKKVNLSNDEMQTKIVKNMNVSLFDKSYLCDIPSLDMDLSYINSYVYPFIATDILTETMRYSGYKYPYFTFTELFKIFMADIKIQHNNCYEYLMTHIFRGEEFELLPKYNLFNKYTFANKFKEFLIIMSSDEDIPTDYGKFKSLINNMFDGNKQSFFNLCDAMHVFNKYTSPMENIKAEARKLNIEESENVNNLMNQIYDTIIKSKQPQKPPSTEEIKEKIENLRQTMPENKLKQAIDGYMKKIEKLKEKEKEGVNEDMLNEKEYYEKEMKEMKKMKEEVFDVLKKFKSSSDVKVANIITIDEYNHDDITYPEATFKLTLLDIYERKCGITPQAFFILFYVYRRMNNTILSYAGRLGLYPISRFNLLNNLSNEYEVDLTRKYGINNDNVQLETYPANTEYSCTLPNGTQYSACAERGIFELLKFLSYNGEGFDSKLFPEMHSELDYEDGKKLDTKLLRNIFDTNVWNIESDFGLFALYISDLSGIEYGQKTLGIRHNLRSPFYMNVLSKIFKNINPNKNIESNIEKMIKENKDLELSHSDSSSFTIKNNSSGYTLIIRISRGHVNTEYITPVSDETFFSLMLSDIKEPILLNTKTETINNLNTRCLTHMDSFFNFGFAGLPILRDCDLSKWNTSNVKSMNKTFNYSIIPRGISNWDTSNVSSMKYTFELSKSTEEQGIIDLNKWDISNVRKMTGLFKSSKSIKIDISRWNLKNVEDIKNNKDIEELCNRAKNIYIKFPKINISIDAHGKMEIEQTKSRSRTPSRSK